MASQLTRAHIEGQALIRRALGNAVRIVWSELPAYDRQNVDEWLARVLPIVDASQRRSASLTAGYLARSLERQPQGIDLGAVVGAAVRNGADPADVYSRPFVTLWTSLGKGADYADAVAAGLDRAMATAEMDVQLSARQTFALVQSETPAIRGYRRVANSGACKFCQMVDGAFVRKATAMALHNRCGCGLEPQLSRAPVDPLPEGVAVHAHGELGPLLGDPAHDFTGPGGI